MPFARLKDYGRSSLRGDLLAGLTLWAVLVPEALAYGALAGVPPVVGLYAAPGALLLYAALGSSRHLVTAPTSGRRRSPRQRWPRSPPTVPRNPSR